MKFILIVIVVLAVVITLGCAGVWLLDRYIQRTGKNVNERALMYFFLGMPLLPFVFVMAVVRGFWEWVRSKFSLLFVGLTLAALCGCEPIKDAEQSRRSNRQFVRWNQSTKSFQPVPIIDAESR